MKLKEITFRTASYFRYLMKSANKHDIHSPFVFKLLTECIYADDKEQLYKIDLLREKLRNDKTIINYLDFGAGGKANNKYPISISRIAGRATKPSKYAALISRLVKYFNFNHFLELGTSLGLTTSTVASRNTQIKAITIEGSPEIFRLAQKNFHHLNLHNIDARCGTFDQLLPGILEDLKTCGLVFIDGNHRKEPTLKYFLQLEEYCKPGSLLVFDDIHWSAEMEEAWQEIKNHPSVSMTIDLYQMGLVFFETGRKEKEHFIIKF